MSYPRFQRARDFKFAKRTSGNFTTSNVGSTFTVIDAALDLTLTAEAGDVVQFGVNMGCARTTGDISFDVGTLVSAAIVNRFAGGTAGMTGLYSDKSFNGLGATYMYLLVSGDITAGTVVLRLLYATSGASQTIYGTTANPLHVWAKNLGPADPN